VISLQNSPITTLQRFLEHTRGIYDSDHLIWACEHGTTTVQEDTTREFKETILACLHGGWHKRECLQTSEVSLDPSERRRARSTLHHKVDSFRACVRYFAIQEASDSFPQAEASALPAVGVSVGQAHHSVSKDKLQRAARLLFSSKMNEKVHIALRSGAINEMQVLVPGTSRKENRFFCTIDFYFGDIAGVTSFESSGQAGLSKFLSSHQQEDFEFRSEVES
jgi:hypothetical protein